MHSSFYSPKPAKTLKIFDDSAYYTSKDDGGIELKPDGVALTCEYYQAKYQTNIELIHKNGANPLEEFLKSLPKFLEKAKSQKGDYRAAFLLGLSGHTTLVFYLKEGDKEGFVFADSLGGGQGQADLVQQQTGIQTFYIGEDRQHDRYSCYADGIILGKDLTRKKADSNDYQYPNLLSYFMNLAEDDKPSDDESDEKDEIKLSPPKKTCLPDCLLKTAQLESFMEVHDLGTNYFVHKKERLDMFRKRYTNSKDFPAYLYEKGLKLTHVIQIQFYLNQVKQIMEGNWDANRSQQFIQQAKQYCKTKPKEKFSMMLYQFTAEFIKNDGKTDTFSNVIENK